MSGSSKLQIQTVDIAGGAVTPEKLDRTLAPGGGLMRMPEIKQLAGFQQDEIPAGNQTGWGSDLSGVYGAIW